MIITILNILVTGCLINKIIMKTYYYFFFNLVIHECLFIITYQI